MIQLSYISSQSHPLTSDEVKKILEKSILNNSLKNVTGMLLFYNGSFLQVLEGNEKRYYGDC